MDQTSNIIYQTTSGLTPSTQLLPIIHKLPIILEPISSATGKVHRLWRGVKRIEVVANPGNWSTLIIGNIFKEWAEDQLLLAKGIQGILLCMRIQEIINQHLVVYNSYAAWIDAVTGTYPIVKEHKWDTFSTNQWLSPSTIIWVNATQEEWVEQSKRIILCTLNLFVQIFKLCMSYLDFIELSRLNPEAKQDAYNELIVYWDRHIEDFNSNIDRLIESLEQKKEVWDPFIHKYFSNKSSSDIITVFESVKKVVSAGGVASDAKTIFLVPFTSKKEGVVAGFDLAQSINQIPNAINELMKKYELINIAPSKPKKTVLWLGDLKVLSQVDLIIYSKSSSIISLLASYISSEKKSSKEN